MLGSLGDYVAGHDGRPHRVTAVQMRDLNGELFTFTPMATRIWALWLMFHPNSPPRYVTTALVSVGVPP